MNATYTISISFGDYANSWRRGVWTSEGFKNEGGESEIFDKKEYAIAQAERAVEFVKEHDLYIGDREVYITEWREVLDEDGESDFETEIVWESGKF